MKNLFSAIAFMFSAACFAQAPVTASISGPATVCSNNPSSYSCSATGANNSYTWSVSPNANITILSAGPLDRLFVFPNLPLTYTLTFTATNGSGSSTSTLAVTVIQVPTITFSGNNYFCQGSSTNLSASPTIFNQASSSLSYTWSPAIGLNTTSGPSVTANPPVTTNYTVTMGLGTCISTYQVTVFVQQPPMVQAAVNPTTICAGQTAMVNVGGTADGYYVNYTQVFDTLAVSPNVTTTYTVLGWDVSGCQSFAFVTLDVSDCTGINTLNAPAIKGLDVYPNPSNGTFTVRSPRDERAMLTNEFGQVLRQVDLRANEEIELRQLPPGIYFLISASSKNKLVVAR